VCSLISQFFFVNGVCKRCKVKNRLYNRSQNQSRQAHERNYYLQKKWVHCFVQLTSNSSPCHHHHRQNTRTFKMIKSVLSKKIMWPFRIVNHNHLNMINAVRHRGSATESALELLSLSFFSAGGAGGGTPSFVAMPFAQL